MLQLNYWKHILQDDLLNDGPLLVQQNEKLFQYCMNLNYILIYLNQLNQF